MASQYIEFVQTRTNTRTLDIQDCWEFKPRGCLVGLLRKAFRWAVGKGYFVSSVRQVMDVTRHRVSPNSVIESLFMQKREVMKLIDREATTVLIGSEDYRELMHSPEVLPYVTFSANVHYGREVLGLTVKIIPWMRGVLVMP